MRRKGQRNFKMGAGFNLMIQVKENTAGAHILRLGAQLGPVSIAALD